jgi:hypothetical protein
MRRRFLRRGSKVLAAALALSIQGCAGRTLLDTEVIVDAGPDASELPDAGVSPAPKSSKLDVLFVVDNSPNTDASHDLLASSIPYLVDRLARPACVDADGNVLAQTASPTDPCPSGARDFSPVTDMHIAVISTSLGGHGADICSAESTGWNPEQNDAAHLLTRGPNGVPVSTYTDKGFLAWDPGLKASPAGDADPNSLSSKLADLVRGAGARGCGFEAQLESWYRFLVDPDPYLSIPIVGGKATPTGTDSALLQQRRDFLRDDSAVLIVVLTDENDCSTRDGSQYFYSNQGSDPNKPTQPFHLPRPTSACDEDPYDPCCVSCGQATPAGCSANDPACLLPGFGNSEDPINLRCFDQKRRFGIDFLQPIDRYVRGLSDDVVPTRDGSLVPNPLFAGGRSPELVMMTGIVGVPWQDIARSPKSIAKGFKAPSEIDWELMLGDPMTGSLPTDPLMVESIEPRVGTNPATGSALAPPSAGPMANVVNGHERDIEAGDDLQHACIYPLSAPAPCVTATCACNPPGDNPICQSADGTYSTVESFARALPSTRPLRLLRELGDRASVGSVCAATVGAPAQPTFGYKPAFDAALRMLRSRLY